jgi:hypothetical protein
MKRINCRAVVARYIFLQCSRGALPFGVELLRKIDAQVSFLEGDFSAEYVMVQQKPGEGPRPRISSS